MWLVCAAVDTQIDMKELNKYLKVGSGNLRGADEQSLAKYLGSIKGTCNYFSIVNDVEKSVKLIIDKKLLEAEWASFHPMDNSSSTAIKKEGINKIKEVCGRDDTSFEILDFSTLQGEAKPAGEQKKPEKKQGKKVEQGKKLTAEEKKKKKEEEKALKTDGSHELSIQYKKEVNFSKWYQEVIIKSDLIDYYDISGCYILKPKSYFIWEQIQKYFDKKIKEHEVDNCYFPMFVS